MSGLDEATGKAAPEESRLDLRRLSPSKSGWTGYVTEGAAFIRARFAQPLARRSVAALAVYVIGAGLTYLAQVATARIIGPDNYGIYAYVLALVTLLAYFATLGFHTSLLRFVPAYKAKEEWSLIAGVIAYSRRATGILGAGIFLIGACAIAAMNGTVRPDLTPALLLGLAAVPFIALNLIGAALVRAFGGVVMALAPERIARDAIVLITLVLAAWSNLFHPDAALAMAATLVSALATLGLVHLGLTRLRPQELKNQKPAYEAASWRRPTIPLAVIMIADNVMTRAAIIVLGTSGDIRDAGIFAAALNLATLASLPRMAVGTVFTPNVSGLYAHSDRNGLQSLIARAACLSLLGTICVAVPLLLLTRPLLAWFGPEFTSGVSVVSILIAGQVFAAATGPQQHLITMTGHERIGALLQATCAGFNLIACMLLVGRLGMVGTAIAMSASIIAWNMAMSIFIYKRLGLLPGLIASVRMIPGAFRRPFTEEAAQS